MAKNCPSCGYRETDNQAQYCNKCGYPFPRGQPAKPPMAAAPFGRPAQRAVKPPARRKSGGGGFLSFGNLITENHLRLIYILGAVLIVLASVIGIAGMFGKPVAKGANVSVTNTTAIGQDPAGSPVFWVLFLVAGSVLWRMFCELFVILARGNGSHGIVEEYEPDDEVAEYGDEVGGYSRGNQAQMIECPKCHRIVSAEDLRECEHCGIQGCVNCIRMMGLLKKTMTCRECFEAK